MSQFTVYYDSACPICEKEMKLYRRLEKQTSSVRWFDLHGPDQADLGPSLTKGEAMKRLHVRLDDGRLLHGAAAFLALYRQLKGLWILGWGLRPLTPMLELLYRGFLKARPHMPRAFQSCSEKGCAIPPSR